MWIAGKSDRLRGLTKNLSEFAREVVAPTYEDEDEPVAEERRGSLSDAGLERYQALIRSLQDSNKALQQEVQDLRQALRASKEECIALAEKCHQEHAPTAPREPIATMAAAEQQLSANEVKAEFCQHLRDMHLTLTGKEPSVPGSLHDQLEEVMGLLVSLKHAERSGGSCLLQPLGGSPALTWPNSSQGSSTSTEPDVEPLRATVKSLRQENEGLKERVARLELGQPGNNMETQQEWQQRLRLQEATHQQQLHERVHMMQQQHAQEKAAGHAELQKCTAELAEQRRRCIALEQQVQAMQLGGRRGQADLEDRYNEAQVIISRLTAQLREQAAMASVHQANFQQETSDLHQKFSKLQRQVAVLQQENQELRDSAVHRSKALDAKEAEGEQFREQLANKEEQIKALQAELAENESEELTHLMEVDNLNVALDMFRREREAEVQSRLGSMRREVEEAHQEAAVWQQEAQRARAEQVTLREEHERELRGKQRQVDCLEEKVQGLLATMEAQMKRMSDDNVIDKTLVSHLFLRYWDMRHNNNGIEVLKVMSKILNWDDAMQRKVGLAKSGGLWNAIFRPGAVDNDLPVTTPQDVAISDLWVNFLERQASSTPRQSSMEGIASDELQRPSGDQRSR
eukprot:GGOE01062150.1.p1 GENE.GGOE01062150.1~~GGOE01062150.1.p1  ORF type:complete len:630 (+),score=184.63 GGOE01062150.1:50-1939(+)